MKVAELMRTELKTISAEATVADAVTALAEAGVSALPVLDRFGRAVGVVSTREILRAESAHDDPAARERLFEDTLVLEIMAPWPFTITPELQIRDAAREMLYRELRYYYKLLGEPSKLRRTADELELTNLSRIVCLPCSEDEVVHLGWDLLSIKRLHLPVYFKFIT